jgi:hypothetical protein
VTLDTFAARCQPAAADLEDRLCRYIDTPQEHALWRETGQRFAILVLTNAMNRYSVLNAAHALVKDQLPPCAPRLPSSIARSSDRQTDSTRCWPSWTSPVRSVNRRSFEGEKPVTSDQPDPRFDGVSDLDLVVLQHEARQGTDPSDQEFVQAILKELDRRHAGRAMTKEEQ